MGLGFRLQPAVNVPGFTTSPALGAVATQYASYLTGHPGSLPVAMSSLMANIKFLHGSMTKFAGVLQVQESLSADAFGQDMDLSKLPTEIRDFVLPDRFNIPILDFGYLSPTATVEAGTPLEALIPMFAGDDSGILAAAAAWTSAGTRITAAVESLQQAAGTLAATTQGEAFTAAATAIEATVAQGTIMAANATAMGAAMTELPPIRATVHARLLAMEAEAQEREAAARATDVVQPGASGAALAAAKLATQAEVASFVTGYLQPALEAARPPVMNLGVEVTGHTGGGTLTTGASGVQAAGQTATQVSGGVSANGQTLATAQYSQSPQQPAQFSAATGPAAQASEVARQATSPAGGATPTGQGTPVGRSTQATPQAGQFAGAAPAGTRAPAPGNSVTGPGGGVGAPGNSGSTVGRTQTSPTTTAGSLSTPGQGTSAGTQSGSARSAGQVATRTRTGVGNVQQPLLPRVLSPGGAGGAGGTGSGTGVPGARGGTGSGSAPGGAGTGRGPATAVPGTGGMMGGGSGAGGSGKAGSGTARGGVGGTGGAGGAGAGGKNGRQSASPFTSGKGRGKSKKDLVKEYFRRQFLGEEPQTVKTVIR